MTKILSIIIPTYNMEKYLRECLDSLIVSDENMQRLEVLVINDGSKDSSSLIAHEYESRFPQTFRVIDKENGNYGSCINRGLREATGKYVKILDADDSFYNDAFNLFLLKLLTIDTDLILTDYNRVLSTKRIEQKRKFALPKEVLLTFEQINPRLDVEMHAVTYRTDLLKEIGYQQTEGISYTDTEWSIIPLTSVKSLIYIGIELYSYLVGREGQTVDPQVRAKSLGMMYKVFKRLLSSYESGLSVDNAANELVFNKLAGLSSSIYKFGINYNTIETRQVLKDMDNYIKIHSNRLYSLLETKRLVNFIPSFYIKDWRNGDKGIIYWKVYNSLIKLQLCYKRIVNTPSTLYMGK